MARVLGRSRSTIFRELKRNHFSDPSMPKCDGCNGAADQSAAANRRLRDRKLIKHTELCKRVIEWLKNSWMPEQIGTRMIHDQALLRVCQETIYRSVYSKEGREKEPPWSPYPELNKGRTSRIAHKVKDKFARLRWVRL